VTPLTNPAIIDIVVIDGRTDQAEMLHRLRAFAMACASLHEVIDGHGTTTDEYFDADTHVRLETIAQARSVRELKRLAARLLAEPFPTGRPEWSLHFVEKVTRNRSALVIRRSARYDERLVNALRGTPLQSSTNRASHSFDVTRLLNVAQQVLLQPDPLNALVDRSASVVARVMQEFDRPDAARSTLWVNRSHAQEHQDLRIDRDVVSEAAVRFGVDERSLLLACFTETITRLHESAPVESVFAGIAIKRMDVDPQRLATIALPTSTMPFAERLHAIDELLLHLPQPQPPIGVEFDEWLPPALVKMLGSRLRHTIDVGCVFAEPLGTLTAVGIEHFSVIPMITTLDAAATMIAVVDGSSLRLGFAVDPASGATPVAIRQEFEQTIRTQLGWDERTRPFSRWWANLQKQSATA
jgi:hypothetical protein